MAGRRPGLGAAAAARSSALSSPATKPSRVASSGFGWPAGGIARARNFRLTFSQTSARVPTRSTSIVSSTRPAVRSRALWHLTQYSSKNAR